MALKARAQLQSLAGNLVVKRGSSSGRGERRQTLTAAAALQDPQLRRQLLNKLRQHDPNGSVTIRVVLSFSDVSPLPRFVPMIFSVKTPSARHAK